MISQLSEIHKQITMSEIYMYLHLVSFMGIVSHFYVSDFYYTSAPALWNTVKPLMRDRPKYSKKWS